MRYRLSPPFASPSLSLSRARAFAAPCSREIGKYEHVSGSTKPIRPSFSASFCLSFADATFFSISRVDTHISAFVSAFGNRIKNGSSRKRPGYRARMPCIYRETCRIACSRDLAISFFYRRSSIAQYLICKHLL